MDTHELKVKAQRLINSTRESLAYRAMYERSQELVNLCASPDYCSYDVYDAAANMRDVYQALYDQSVRRREWHSIDFAYEYKARFGREIPTLNCFRFATQIRID